MATWLSNTIEVLRVYTFTTKKGRHKLHNHSQCAQSSVQLVALTPAGFLVHLAEIADALSLELRYFFVGDVFAAAPDINTVILDNACR